MMTLSLWTLPDRLGAMPTVNAAIFVICACSLLPIGLVMTLATRTALRRYPPSVGRWKRVKPIDAVAGDRWVRRGRQAWAIIFILFSNAAFTVYLLWWCWVNVGIVLPEEGIAVHGLRLLSGLFLAWAFGPGSLRGSHD